MKNKKQITKSKEYKLKGSNKNQITRNKQLTKSRKLPTTREKQKATSNSQEEEATGNKH